MSCSLWQWAGSVLVREFTAPGFDLAKGRPRSIVAPILSARWHSLQCLQPRACGKEKRQPCCTGCFIRKPDCLKPRLCREEPTTPLHNVMLLLGAFASIRKRGLGAPGVLLTLSKITATANKSWVNHSWFFFFQTVSVRCIPSCLSVCSCSRHAAEIQTASKELRTEQHGAAHAVFLFFWRCAGSPAPGQGSLFGRDRFLSPGDEAAPLGLTWVPTWCLPGQRHLQATIVSSCDGYLRGLRRCESGARRWQKGNRAHGCGINPSSGLWGAETCSGGAGARG